MLDVWYPRLAHITPRTLFIPLRKCEAVAIKAYAISFPERYCRPCRLTAFTRFRYHDYTWRAAVTTLSPISAATIRELSASIDASIRSNGWHRCSPCPSPSSTSSYSITWKYNASSLSIIARSFFYQAGLLRTAMRQKPQGRRAAEPPSCVGRLHLHSAANVRVIDKRRICCRRVCCRCKHALEGNHSRKRTIFSLLLR